MKLKNTLILLLIFAFALTLFGCPKPPPPLQLVTIHFEFDKYDLTPEARDIMASNAQSMADRPEAVIKIEGNCDERGTDEYNLALGEKRAQTAKEYLVNYGVDETKISIVSYGESRPVDPGHNEDAWAKNRRDDFVVISE